MHGIYGGVAKALISLWFDTCHHSQAWYCKNKTSQVDGRLQTISPTFETTKATRSICDRKYWKASEYQYFLLFYSLPCMKGILPDNYYDNLKTLVTAVYLLNKDSISDSDIQESEKLLLDFHKTFINLYGERYGSINVHYLLHLPEMVKDLGPLWANTCFEFENANSIVKKLFHGTKKIDVQIMESVAAIQFLHYELSLSGEEAISSYGFLKERNVSYGRDISYIKGVGRLTTRHYSRSKKKADFAIMYTDGDEQKFGVIEDLNDHSSFTVIELRYYTSLSAHITQFHPINCFNQAKEVAANKICGKCIYMDIDSGLFLASVPKNFLSD